MTKYSLGTHFLLLFLLFSATSTTSEAKFSMKPTTQAQLKEKLSHLHFYFHDVVSGRSPTAIRVTQPPNPTAPSLFGMITMMDDLLTESPDPASEPVGRAQGIYASAALQELGFLMAMNLAFTQGKYNGSVLTVLGRNAPFHEVREMPIVGGSGLFRFARGYALARTHWIDLATGDAIVEYNVHVLHY